MRCVSPVQLLRPQRLHREARHRSARRAHALRRVRAWRTISCTAPYVSAISGKQMITTPSLTEVRDFVHTVTAQARAATQDMAEPGLLQVVLIHPATNGAR